MAEVEITVYGTPAPQGSKRAFAVRGKGGVPTGKVAVIESSHDRVKSWRQAVIDAAQEARPRWGGAFTPGMPLELTVAFWLKRPKGHYRTGKNAHLLRELAPLHPAGMPDLSKLIRSTEDALTAVGIWGDDAQVVTCSAAKVWCPRDHAPGAHITIREIWEQEP
jgi:crossover junction endodeoxyribonuclease RusA